jgi:hypothetical protein
MTGNDDVRINCHALPQSKDEAVWGTAMGFIVYDGGPMCWDDSNV